MQKYRPYETRVFTKRNWPNNTVTSAPTWVSVDLRDGNQSLDRPMSVEQKMRFFDILVQMGFKHIEVAFPSASSAEFEFTRRLIEEQKIPDDVTIQVLVQAKEQLIRRTFEALEGVKKATVHLYNSTSKQQRRVVFGKTDAQIIELAVEGTKIIKSLAANNPDVFGFEYSPESFSGTELEFAKDICDAVIQTWQPTRQNKMMINLPNTVESCTPNVYADRIEWMSQNLTMRESIRLSIHPHNDRGTAVACAELAMLAGVDRVEGTILGNGERAGNLDLVTLAFNLYSHGIDPKLKLSNIDEVIQKIEGFTGIDTHIRHPYVGQMIYTAFSGSHQDAIKKGLEHYEKNGGSWDVPYLPIDPKDLGRSYEELIKINSQSGKAAAAFVLKNSFGLDVPKNFHAFLASKVQEASEKSVGSIDEAEIYSIFFKNLVNIESPVSIESQNLEINDTATINMVICKDGKKEKVGASNKQGALYAAVEVFERFLGRKIAVKSFDEHAVDSNGSMTAMAYICADIDGKSYFGAGVDANLLTASIKALLSAVNSSFQ